MNTITKSLFILYLIITHHLLYANIHIEKANTYLEWMGMVSYPSQNLAIPLVWAIPPPDLLSINITCNDVFVKIDPDKDILDKQMKDIDIGLEVDVINQLCVVNDKFCINRSQEQETRPRVGFIAAISLIATAISLIVSSVSATYTLVNNVKSENIKELYEKDEADLMSKIDDINIKLEALEKNVEKLKEDLCDINNNITSINLANQYLAIYWNKYKRVLDSAVRGEVNHQLLNLDELSKLIMDKNLEYRYNELDMLSMFRASRFLLTKHDASTPSIHGILIVPIILKTQTLPVYRPLTLTTANTQYYKFPNEIAISYIKNHYHVYQLDGCSTLNDRYICPINAAKTSDKTREIEDFMNDIDRLINLDIAEYDRGYIEGINGVYVKKDQEYTLIKISDNLHEVFKRDKNSFINYDEFDVLIVGERKITGSDGIAKSLRLVNRGSGSLLKAYNEITGTKELLLKNNLLNDEKVEYTPPVNTIWAYLMNSIDNYKYIAISGYISVLILLFWIASIECRIRIKHLTHGNA